MSSKGRAMNCGVVIIKWFGHLERMGERKILCINLSIYLSHLERMSERKILYLYLSTSDTSLPPGMFRKATGDDMAHKPQHSPIQTFLLCMFKPFPPPLAHLSLMFSFTLFFHLPSGLLILGPFNFPHTRFFSQTHHSASSQK